MARPSSPHTVPRLRTWKAFTPSSFQDGTSTLPSKHVRPKDALKNWERYRSAYMQQSILDFDVEFCALFNVVFRIPVMILGALVAPTGLFIYGWTAQARAHWILPDVGISIYAFGFVASIVNTNMYIVDYYGIYAASAVAAVSFAQSIFGFLLPLFGPALYLAMGYGWGNSIMGFVGVGVGWLLPWLLWRFGSALQKRSAYSARV